MKIQQGIIKSDGSLFSFQSISKLIRTSSRLVEDKFVYLLKFFFRPTNIFMLWVEERLY